MKDYHKIKISGTIESRGLVLISVLGVTDRPGIAGEILSYMGENNINIEYITESGNIDNSADITFCISRDDLDRAEKLIREIAEKVKAKDIKIYPGAAIIGVYGPHFREKPAIAGRLCRALGREGINILSISTSISTVSCVIDDENFARAQRAIKKVFLLPE
ncbi:MAG: hypothetical protein DRP91_05195 [Candidatus Neomarinimicrobiota bacterium]|nr:ACT domain-containing protein [Candidatus Neomarinimicrobiota bacterium]MCD6100270.1 ACT domain-containing protein [Candidatus Neomarinimicrobiota bacterium]RKY48422.1 MAG: hypothetical protein DRP88_02160 [Candidatus Neomarinimicrobiota bacterium]RKY48907.1 MAG: hypothetical protein DRP91_05195 [Candidatus Neomarinimicrobiota bacterium]RKY53517.1 MAG: hypothetical protein DRP92_03320 [Candidatus Neomarinimicrobiota bacterium]